MADERPRLHALVSLPLRQEPEWWTAPALVSLELALELKEVGGYMIVGPDPQDERDLAMYERLVRAVEKHRHKKWYEAP